MRSWRGRWTLLTAGAVLVGCAAGRAGPPRGPWSPIEEILARTPPQESTVETFDPSTADLGTNVRVSLDPGFVDESEPSISVSPIDPANLVAAAIDDFKCGYYASFDGGATWTGGFIPGIPSVYGVDPVVAHCADGSVVYLCLGFGGPYGIYVSRSTDGGRTWSDPSIVEERLDSTQYPDKPWIDCDRTQGRFSNRIYVAWAEIHNEATSIQWSYSRNSGGTWSAPDFLADEAQGQAVALAVGADGTVHATWWAGTEMPLSILYDRSTDGGRSFGTDRFVGTIDEIPNLNYSRPSFPLMTVDRSNGPHSGNIYVVFPERVVYGNDEEADVFLIRSTDGGTTWSPKLRVNDDPLHNGADQYFPFPAVDSKGRLVVSFYDKRRFIGQALYDVWAAVSRDGGATFDTNILVSSTPSLGTRRNFIGHYQALAATADHLYPLWTDLRGIEGSDLYIDRQPHLSDYDEVRGLVWLDATRLDFETQDARFGQDLRYDVASGLLSELAASAGFAQAACAANDWDAPPLVDTRIPAADDGYWYLVRATGPNGVGSYGDATPARPNVRDPLDETIPACP